MSRSQKKAHVEKGCVACGSCIKHCPMGAIMIYKGIHAVVDDKKCVGCGKCTKACPADIINIITREVKAI